MTYAPGDKIEWRNRDGVWVPGVIIGVITFEPDNYPCVEIELYNGKFRKLFKPEISIYLRHQGGVWDAKSQRWVLTPTATSVM